MSGQFAHPGSWCSTPRSPLPRALDTAAVAWVNTWDYLPAGLGLYLTKSYCDDVKIKCSSGSASFSSAHYTTALARVLVCGGGDSIYNVTRCRPVRRERECNTGYLQRLLVASPGH